MISVIVPVYKAEKYVGGCIESILSQTYGDFELILVDDGSPDSSGAICDCFALRDSRIKVIHQENRGVSAARNAGLQQAKGEYICFVDADDYADGAYLRVLREHMPSGGLAACLMYDGRDAVCTERSLAMQPDEAQISAFSGFGMGGSVWGKLFQTEIIRQNALAFACDLAICEDLLFVIRYLSCISSQVVWNQSCLYYYRRENQGASEGRFRRRQDFRRAELTELDALECCRPYLYPNNEELEKAYSARTAKAAVNTLRAMTANRCQAPVQKKKLQSLIRKSAFACLQSPYLRASSKISVCVSSVSPAWEYWMWRLFNPQKTGT